MVDLKTGDATVEYNVYVFHYWWLGPFLTSFAWFLFDYICFNLREVLQSIFNNVDLFRCLLPCWWCNCLRFGQFI
jgi:hypothetical protein